MNNIYNIYKYTLEAAEEERKVRIDIIGRTLVVDGNVIIDKGNYCGELGLPVVETNVALQMIENAYMKYKTSMPDEGTNVNTTYRNSLFKALPSQDLSDDDLIFSEYRSFARTRLELTVLIMLLNKSIDWNSEQLAGKWFWQSSKDKNLVLLKQWIV